ncbi:MAG: HAMP domain-containing sensor histidine kinase [Acholeplasmataceae bacterium]
MKKLYVKMFLSMFLITFLSVFIPRVVLSLFGISFIDYYNHENVFFIGMIITGSITLIASFFWFNYFIIRRITYVSHATQKISQGEFNIHIEEKGYDEISQLSHHFNVMTDALRNNQYVSQSFMKNYAHEFKTPISVIKGYAELIENTDDMNEVKQYAQIIGRQSSDLSQLAQNILEFAMLEREGMIIKNETYSINEQIRLIIQSMQMNWEEKNIELDLNLEHFSTTSNKELTYLMLRNIIDNAIKYANNNSILTINTRKTDKIYIDIRNAGPKIEDDELEKIFDLFYRDKTGQNLSGHGVGLSIVKRIAEILDIDINVQSDELYTTFSLQIKA